LSLPRVRNSISRVYQVVTLLILPINIVLARIGQSKKKCFKFSRAAPHRQDGSDTIPTRNKSKFKNEAEFLCWIKIIFNFRGPQKKCLGTAWFSISSMQSCHLWTKQNDYCNIERRGKLEIKLVSACRLNAWSQYILFLDACFYLHMHDLNRI
jgi:hypothetical protein